ncbi:MAG: 2TM domain-containing protein [Bacteroidota bacterium]
MKYKELRKKAEKKVQAKMAFFICATVFFFTTIILMTLSFYLTEVAFWLRLPIPAFMLVLGVLYLVAFGVPTTNGMSENWQEEEIEKEMLRLYRQKKALQSSVGGDATPSERLELKELEQLEEKWDRRTDDLV